jgi:hypothetical protein
VGFLLFHCYKSAAGCYSLPKRGQIRIISPCDRVKFRDRINDLLPLHSVFFSSGVTAVRGTDVRMPHRLDDQLGSYVIIQQDACVGLPDLVRGTTGDPDRITGVIQRGLIGSFMTPAALSALTLTGSVLILATGINLIWDKDIKVVNLTPAIIVAVILSSLIS